MWDKTETLISQDELITNSSKLRMTICLAMILVRHVVLKRTLLMTFRWSIALSKILGRVVLREHSHMTGLWWKELVSNTSPASFLRNTYNFSYKTALLETSSMFHLPAFQIEIDWLFKVNTRKIVSLPKSAISITGELVITVKDSVKNSEELFEGANVRFFGIGFQKVEVANYTYTFASVVKYTLIPTLLALVAN